MFWDDSAGQVTWLQPSAGLFLSGTTLSTGPQFLASTVGISSGTTVDIPFTIADFPSKLIVVLDGISFTAAATLSITVTNDNFVSVGTARAVSATTAAAAGVVNGYVNIDVLGTFISSTIPIIYRPTTTIGTGTTLFSTQSVEAVKLGAPNGIRLSGGTFDAGSVYIYAIY
jgi:hypothetical protein